MLFTLYHTNAGSRKKSQIVISKTICQISNYGLYFISILDKIYGYPGIYCRIITKIR